MTASEAVFNAARQYAFLFSGFISLSATLAIAQALSGREKARWSALMTGVWVAINGGIAVWLFRHIHLPAAEMAPHVFTHITAYMWLNIVADAVYALAGLFLLSRRGTHRPMLRGFGGAVLIQAAGLFVLDALFLAHVIVLRGQYAV